MQPGFDSTVKFNKKITSHIQVLTGFRFHYWIRKILIKIRSHTVNHYNLRGRIIHALLSWIEQGHAPALKLVLRDVKGYRLRPFPAFQFKGESRTRRVLQHPRNRSRNLYFQSIALTGLVFSPSGAPESGLGLLSFCLFMLFSGRKGWRTHV